MLADMLSQQPESRPAGNPGHLVIPIDRRVATIRVEIDRPSPRFIPYQRLAGIRVTHILSRSVDEVRRIGLAFQELPVEQPKVVDEDVHHSQGKRAVRSRPDRHPLVRLGGGIGTDRIDHDQFRTAPAGIRHALDRLQGIVVHAVTILRSRKEDVVAEIQIDLRIERPQRQEERRVQSVSAGNRVELVVRSAERNSETLRRRVIVDIERGDNQFPRILITNLCQLARDYIDGFLPADFLPHRIDAKSLFGVCSSQWPGQSFRIVHVRDSGL